VSRFPDSKVPRLDDEIGYLDVARCLEKFGECLRSSNSPIVIASIPWDT
jgi:hypothetical protein